MAFAKKEELPPGPSMISATTLTLHLEDLSLLSPQDTLDHSIMTRAIISILDPHAPMFSHLTTLTLETISVPDQFSYHNTALSSSDSPSPFPTGNPTSITRTWFRSPTSTSLAFTSIQPQGKSA